MFPHINDTCFGSITINHEKYDFDVYILPDNHVEKRHKKLSKKIYGTSHKISKDEVKFIYREGVNALIIGTGQYGCAEISDEAARYLDKRKCSVNLFTTPKAVQAWNTAEGKAIGLFHVTY